MLFPKGDGRPYADGQHPEYYCPQRIRAQTWLVLAYAANATPHAGHGSVS